MPKIIVISAPSGSGKSTIINYLLEQNLGLEFSISATSRKPRGEEAHGKEYYFISADEFKEKIKNNEFLEYEEVYKNRFYGTLKTEINRIAQKGHNAIFDVDVVGAQKIKDAYDQKALSIFIKPPSIGELRNRLGARGTDDISTIDSRMDRAEYELAFEDKYDIVIVNDDLEEAKKKILKTINDFISK